MKRPKPLNRQQIDHEALNCVEGFTQKEITKVRLPIDVERMIEQYYGLTLNIDNLEEYFGIKGLLGAMQFENNAVWIDESLVETPSIPPQYAPPKRDWDKLPSIPIFGLNERQINEGRYNFTLAHELGHYVLHSNLLPVRNHEQLTLFEPPQINAILCRDNSQNSPDTPKDDTYWREWQADNFAGALLMPKQVMLAEISERWPKNALPHKQATAWRYVKEELAKVGRVSMQALNIRLKNLGLQDENECYLGNYW